MLQHGGDKGCVAGHDIRYLQVDAVATSSDTYSVILKRIQPHVQYLLDNDMESLLNALYRIDVDELKFRSALELGDPRDIAKNVSVLILDRVILKAQTRLKYQV